MFLYSLKLAIANLRNRPDLTILTISLVAIGLALLTVMTTMSHQSTKLPLADKSENLHLVLLDSREKDADNIETIRNMPFLTYLDTMNLINADNPGIEKTYIWKSFSFLNLESGEANPRQVRTMAGQYNFFGMFDTPFLYGRGWSQEEDNRAAQVIVLSYEMNKHFFAGENSVGKIIRINSTPLKVIGVIAQWQLPSRFYDRSFSTSRFDDVFLPSTMAMALNLRKQIGCWTKDNDKRQSFSLEDLDGLKASECRWTVFWAESKDAASAENYRNYLDRYVDEQKSLGRFPREIQNELISLKDYSSVMFARMNAGSIFKILSWLFFAVCLVNTIGILLAKYIGKIPEIALRRALGAKKQVILSQYMIEIAFISSIGGALGLVLSHFGLIAMMHISIYQSDYTVSAEAIKHVYQLDWTMIMQGLAIAVGSTLLVSLFPVWNICNTPPAGQLKAQ